MSILIEGMNLPKSCDNCDLIQFDDEGLEAHCPLSPYYRWCGTPPDYRPEGCPLVEIRTPHGRLIDADELIRCLPKWLADTDVMRVFERIIKRHPTITEAEVSE